MILGKFLFIFLLVIIGFLISIFSIYFTEIMNVFIKKTPKYDPTIENNISDLLFYIFLLYIPSAFIFYVYYVPNVYVINGCDSYVAQVLVFPKESANLKMKLDSDYCYILNKSSSPIHISTLVYDMSQSDLNKKLLQEARGEKYEHKKITGYIYDGKYVNGIIGPNEELKLYNEEVHYVFAEPEKRVNVKYKGKLRYKLSCSG
ncbi:hypothetical protein CSC80_03580 [Maribacter sp. 6B07]|uniref:hypothetical protein n=1 Tax=Maribacter sp. 6B07 TaxID=2045442 RepID=UPI000C0809A8|nr:hypothetical protein [Maribacter sp. 6B07]PHN94447.1 hypothetical protein CSC80_03580 [Maribacter sp. 6B07]